MEFEWDEQKAVLNRQKHGVDFRDAAQIFFDFDRLEAEDDYLTEERFRVIGRVYGTILFVVYTFRDERIRIISARKATGYEKQQYSSY